MTDVRKQRTRPLNWNPAGPATGQQRVFRGGTWYYPAGGVRSDSRGGIGPDYCNWGLGFRVVTEEE